MTAEGYLNLVIGAHSAAKGRSSINPWISANWLGLVIPSVRIASRHTRSASPPHRLVSAAGNDRVRDRRVPVPEGAQ